MSYSPLSLSRRHVLGDLYGRCDPIAEGVPVYLDGEERELLGEADQCLGHYADAFSFHLSDDLCKKLSAGHFTYSFDYEHTEPEAAGRKRIKLTSITLIARKAYQKPIPKASKSKEAAAAAVAVAEAE